MKHKWDNKITRKIRFKTCKVCGTIYETGWPSVYFRPYTNRPYFSAGDCAEILEKSKNFKMKSP